MFNESALDCSSIESAINQSYNNDDGANITGLQSQPEDTTLPVDENNDRRLTQNLRNYLEKECYMETEWSNGFFFNASTDKQTYSKIDMTRYVDDSKFKKKKHVDMYKIYFNPEDYLVNDKIYKMSQLSENIPVKQKICLNLKVKLI